MRFKEFLSEKEHNDYFDWEEIVKEIATGCEFFLSESEEQPMFRGIKSVKPFATFNSHPVNREPRDSTKDFNFMFNALIDIAFDIEDVRAKSVFVVGIDGAYTDYGQAYFIFPIGKFEYLWSPTIIDSYNNDRVIYDAFRWGKLRQLYHDATGKIFAGSMTPVLKGLFRYLAHNASLTPHEWVKDYPGAREITEDTLEVEFGSPDVTDYSGTYESLISAMKHTGRDKYYHSEYLHDALTMKSEIMIYKSAGYYAVNADFVDKIWIKNGRKEVNPYAYLLESIKNAV